MIKAFPHLTPDYCDASDKIFPSFTDIRRKTFATIYPDTVDDSHLSSYRDKSPKGFVDAPIQDLVDLINTHPSYATVSSCSGRIALFDPCLPQQQNTVIQDDTNLPEQNYSSTVKGRGGWLLAAHEKIPSSTLLELMNETSYETKDQKESTNLFFKMEPMLLHVAAATLDRGQQLLQLALRLGFRESGLIVTEQRVTVAIRSYALALSVPLQRTGPLRPNDDYLVELVVEANRRLDVNHERMKRLSKAIEKDFFKRKLPKCRIRCRKLADLNLWGHAVVASATETGTDIIVFGGYGTGPNRNDSSSSSGPARSSKVYRLQQKDGCWKTHWDELQIIHCSKDILGLECQAIAFAPREGTGVCQFCEKVLVLFGGRMSPKRPLGDLLLFCCDTEELQYGEPVDVRGTLPYPRWGHTMTQLTTGRIALAGGRGEDVSYNDIHILTLMGSSGSKPHLLWEQLELNPQLPTFFHHSAVLSSEALLIFGGLSDPENLLDAFSHSTDSHAFMIDLKRSEAIPLECGNVARRFGHASCAVGVVNDEFPDGYILVSGGVRIAMEENNFVVDISCMTCVHEDHNVTLEELELDLDSDVELDLGTLVHHSCVQDPRNLTQVALIGGGTVGFAFGQTFSQSYLLSLSFSHDPEVDQLNTGTSPELMHPTPKDVAHSSQSDMVCPVLYVAKQNAKTLKLQLEESSLLDKRYRMTPANPFDNFADPSNYIAVPVLPGCLARMNMDDHPSWLCLVEGQGEQVLPCSTSMFANRKKIDSYSL